LIANRRIRVSKLQGNPATNGKSRVSHYELKTVRTIGIREDQPVMDAIAPESRQVPSNPPCPAETKIQPI